MFDIDISLVYWSLFSIAAMLMIWFSEREITL